MKMIIALALSGLLAASCTSTQSLDATFPHPGDSGEINDTWRGDPRKPEPKPTLYRYGELYRGGPSGREIWLSTQDATDGTATKGLAGKVNDFVYLRSAVEAGTREAHVVAIMSTQPGARPEELAADRWFYGVAGPEKEAPAWTLTLSVWASHHVIGEFLRVDFAQSGAIERVCISEGRRGNRTIVDGERLELPQMDRDRNSCATENADAVATQLGTARIVAPTPFEKQGRMALRTAALLSAIELTRWMILHHKVQIR